jgi:starch synthase
VVEDGVTGFLVNPLHMTVLGERLRRVLLDPALAARLGAAGRARAVERFGVPRQVEATLRLYDELLAGRGGPGQHTPGRHAPDRRTGGAAA